MKLEVVVVPVSDVDRAKTFYKALGWREDADFVTGARLPGRVTPAPAVHDSAADLAETLLRPGEAVHQAREAAATAQVDVAAGLAWRDFMVSDYSDAGQQAWLARKGIDLIRGTGQLAGPGVVEVDGRCYTAAHVVLATGSDPVVPPIPGLPELDGIWTNREVTGMKAVPHHLLVLGGGPVGTE